MKTKIPAYTTTAALLSKLRTKFPTPEFAFFEEVGSSTGFGAQRHIDAVTMGIWPSRGLLLQGFELKASRGDWLREMKNPAKAEAIYKYCDHWWLVCAEGVALPDEIPATWGWMELNGKILYSKKMAPKLDAVPLSRGFLAAILRKVPETTVPKSVYEEEKKTLRDALRVEVEASMKGNQSWHKADLERLEQRVKEFEERSGIQLHGSWPFHDAAATGAAVKTLLEMGSVEKHKERVEGDLLALLNRAETIAKMIREKLKPKEGANAEA